MLARVVFLLLPVVLMVAIGAAAMLTADGDVAELLRSLPPAVTIAFGVGLLAVARPYADHAWLPSAAAAWLRGAGNDRWSWRYRLAFFVAAGIACIVLGLLEL